jgi:hypothetical protein
MTALSETYGGGSGVNTTVAAARGTGGKGGNGLVIVFWEE